MFWLLTSLMLLAEPAKEHKEIYVAPPTINDPSLNSCQMSSKVDVEVAPLELEAPQLRFENNVSFKHHTK